MNFFLFCLIIQISFSAVAQHMELPLCGGKVPNYQETNEEEIWVQDGVLKIRNVKKPGVEVFYHLKN